MKTTISKTELKRFIIESRTKTYAGNSGQVSKPFLQGSRQLEYSKSDWLYRDIYNIGNKKFIGFETIYFKNTPVLSMSYYGNFEKMTEEEVDKILRKALIDKGDNVRLWNVVKYKMDEYSYINEGSGNIDQFEGSERIEKNGKTLYFFYYASGLIG